MNGAAILNRKEPLSKEEKSDVEDFKNIMRGTVKVNEFKKSKLERVARTLEKLNGPNNENDHSTINRMITYCSDSGTVQSLKQS